MLSPSLQIDSLNWKTVYYEDNYLHEIIQKTNWDKLCELASLLNNGLPCTLLDRITNGLHNLVRLVEFSDQTRWIARINLQSSAANSAKLRSEVDAMQLIKDRSSLPIPKIFAYEIDENNPICVPFLLMEFIPGNTAMDSAGGYDVHRGRIPLAYRQTFYRSVASFHLQMTDLRFSKIGTISRTVDGKYDIGPFPDIGGPFDTATDFFEAWAGHARFPNGENEILRMMEGGPAQQVLKSINEFPTQIKAMAHRLSKYNHGPFPLCHRDFLHSNMIVNDLFEVIAVIDWEGACTVPLELVEFPKFLNTMPIQFGSPESYDIDGQPVDKEQQQRWKERQDYIEMVKSAEQDNMLSGCLSDKKSLALAYSLTAYSNGKLGFYDKIIDGEIGLD